MDFVINPPNAQTVEGVVSVKDTGAVGDGVANDTAAIQAAFTAVPNGGAVLFPPGTYKTTAAITVDVNDITITGYGTISKILLAAGSNSNVFRFNSTADTSTNGTIRKSRVILRDLLIDMQGVSQGNVAGGIDGCIAAPAIDHFQATNVYIKNSKNNAFELRGCTNVKLRGCTVDGVYFGNNGNGFSMGRTGNLVGADYVIEGCTTLGVQGVAFWTGGDGGHRLTVHGCNVRSDSTRIFADGNITSGLAVLTSASASFTKQDEGKTVTIKGAGAAGVDLVTRIVTFTNATTVTVGSNAGTTVTNAVFTYAIDGAPARRVVDANITSTQTTLTSATATFTANDVGKGVYILGGAAAGANLRSRIAAFTNSTTVTIQDAAGTTVTNGVALINTTESGVVAEGSTGNSDHISIIGNHVDGTVNNGIGATDAQSSTVGSKHDFVTISGNTVRETYGTAAITVTGTNISVSGNTVENFHGAGVFVGGNDFDEHGFAITGNVLKAASDATSDGIRFQKSGTTNPLRDITVTGNRLYGNGAGASGLSVNGTVKALTVTGNSVSKWKNNGLLLAAAGGTSPSDIAIIANDIRNNNQGVNAAGATSAGIACEASADSISIIGNRITDDQGGKTQTHAIHWLSATRGRIKENDLRGNLTGPFNVAFDTKTVCEGNIGVDDLYESEVTLVAGTATVSTTAVTTGFPRSVIELSKVVFGGTQGAVYVSAITNNTSFVITSTSNTDTSTVKWRIR